MSHMLLKDETFPRERVQLFFACLFADDMTTLASAADGRLKSGNAKFGVSKSHPPVQQLVRVSWMYCPGNEITSN